MTVQTLYASPSSDDYQASRIVRTYITVSMDIPLSAIGTWAMQLTAQNPGSNYTTTKPFTIHVTDYLDYHQITFLLQLTDVPAVPGLTTDQMTAVRDVIGYAFDLNSDQISLSLSLRRQRSLLQASDYVVKVAVNGLNGEANAGALAQSIQLTVGSGQFNQYLTASGKTMLSRQNA